MKPDAPLVLALDSAPPRGSFRLHPSTRDEQRKHLRGQGQYLELYRPRPLPGSLSGPKKSSQSGAKRVLMSLASVSETGGHFSWCFRRQSLAEGETRGGGPSGSTGAPFWGPSASGGETRCPHTCAKQAFKVEFVEIEVT